MSKSVLLKSSIAKKYWMALTGLFLCLFLVGHLLGNLQLFVGGEVGKRAFNEYAYFMTHNPLIKVMSWITYISILFHAVDGILLAIQNKKARPVKYAYTNPGANSSLASRSMALLGSIVLIFIATHMANFWWKMKYSSDPIPLHTVKLYPPLSQNPAGDEAYITTSGSFLPKEQIEVKNGNELHIADMSEQLAMMNPGMKIDGTNPKFGEGYKDLHSVVMAFFGHDKKDVGIAANEFALLAVIGYVLAMAVLAFHLLHGFASAFQSLGVRHPRYTNLIATVGKGFAILIPLGFASIPVFIYLTK
jgi:succinate dehydrogenase / fumarate reductase cytochrome b subunit